MFEKLNTKTPLSKNFSVEEWLIVCAIREWRKYDRLQARLNRKSAPLSEEAAKVAQQMRDAICKMATAAGVSEIDLSGLFLEA